jgi:hypothetical protein
MSREPGAIAELRPVFEPPEDFLLFGDGRDKAFINAMGATLARERRMRRAELDEALAERVVPQLKKVAELELACQKLAGAVDVLRGAAPPPPAKFPAVKMWKEGSISYAGDVVSFGGGTYQAKRDTARAPGSQDWVCLAVAGAGFTIRGTYYGGNEYKHLDVVMVNGSSFVALKDAPGPCPGEDWHLLASRGSRGSRGERGFAGLTGAKGEAAPVIRAWKIDRVRYTATPIMSDSSMGPPLELHGLFEQFLLETSNG